MYSFDSGLFLFVLVFANYVILVIGGSDQKLLLFVVLDASFSKRMSAGGEWLQFSVSTCVCIRSYCQALIKTFHPAKLAPSNAGQTSFKSMNF